MTAINIASSIIYTKGAPLREKIQTFALAGIFLFLLYNSPSGLVFYWVLNQIFSLCKNIVKKYFHPKAWQVVYILLVVYFFSSCVYPIFTGSFKFTLSVCTKFVWVLIFAVSPYLYKYKTSIRNFVFRKIVYIPLVCLFVFVSLWLCFFRNDPFSGNKVLFYVLSLVFIIAPFAWNFLKSKKWLDRISPSDFVLPDGQSFALLLFSCVSLCLLCGLLLPSSVIATSPAEFSFLGSTDSPLTYVWSSLVFFAGLFVFWPLVIYKMFGENKTVKTVMPVLFFVFSVCALANAFLFKYDYGMFNLCFVLDNKKCFDVSKIYSLVLPFLFLVFVFIIYYLFNKIHDGKIAAVALIAINLSLLSVGMYFCRKISLEYTEIAKTHIVEQNNGGPLNYKEELRPVYHLSKTQKNVIVLFLDRAISSFVPEIMEELPYLLEEFKGFTYYPNTVGFGLPTMAGCYAMCGGYEYTPERVDARSGELMVDKQNEAVSLMPRLFLDAGFDVSTDFSNCFGKQNGLLDYSKVHTESNLPNCASIYANEHGIQVDDTEDINCAKFGKRFALMQILFPVLRKQFYNKGLYYAQRPVISASIKRLLKEYANLEYLANSTDFTNNSNTFAFISSDLTHCPAILDLPEYVFSGKDFISDDGNSDQHYHVNAAALRLLGNWLDYLRDNGVYDNTRIIIVSDHGWFFKLKNFETFSDEIKPQYFNSILMAKDFNQNNEFFVDNTFMTNADVLEMAIRDLPVSNINPFTGNEIISGEKEKQSPQKLVNIAANRGWMADTLMNRTTFLPDGAEWFSVRDNIFDESNWTKLDASEAAK